MFKARIENGKVECASMYNSFDATVQESDNVYVSNEAVVDETIEKRLILRTGGSGMSLPTRDG
jgi:hypothetical protein